MYVHDSVLRQSVLYCGFYSHSQLFSRSVVTGAFEGIGREYVIANQEGQTRMCYVAVSLVHQTLSLPLPWGWGRENGLGNLAALSCALQECL